MLVKLSNLSQHKHNIMHRYEQPYWNQCTFMTHAFLCSAKCTKKCKGVNEAASEVKKSFFFGPDNNAEVQNKQMQSLQFCFSINRLMSFFSYPYP